MGARYQGRMFTDGYGNLLVFDIDDDGNEGENHGMPIAHNLKTDRYEFLSAGDPSHNAQHHKQFAELTATQDVDPELPGYAGTVKDPVEGAEHHFEAHIDRSDSMFNTIPDSLATITTGHTAAYEGRGGK